MIAINSKTIYLAGIECVQADFLATDTPDAMPEQTTEDMLGVKTGVYIYAGSSIWCADTGTKWILWDMEGTWCDASDPTNVFTPADDGE